MLSAEAIAPTLVAAAVLAGLTGTWSPCGFSMIETIGPVGHRGGAATTLAACLAFTVGAVAGGVATFGGLAAAGELVHGASGRLAYAAAAVIALVAAGLEVRGTPIVPQVRRQLPEHWRRLMPMPLAAALYGVLLGLGFTTFVLTFGVFALAGVVFALGDPGLGFAVGVGFGLARALPVALTAPIAAGPLGQGITELMAGRPGILRGLRVGDGLALLAAAAVLAAAQPATAAQLESKPAADPSTGGGALAFQRPDRSGFIRRGGAAAPLPGRDPALGDGRVAVLAQGEIVLLSASGLGTLGRYPAADADALAVSRRWLVWRSRRNGNDYMHARRIADPERPGPIKALGRAGGAAQLGRPSLDGNRLVYARATRRANSIVRRLLGASRKRRAKTVLMRSRAEGLSNPTIRGERLLYVRHTRRSDELRLARAGARGKGRKLLSRRDGTLWSTALTAKRAYVTQIHGTAPRQKIISAQR